MGILHVIDIFGRAGCSSHLLFIPKFQQRRLRMYVNGMGCQGIDRVTGIHHTTIIQLVMQVGQQLPDAYDPENVPPVGELDELQTFVGSKKTKSGFGQQLTTFNQVS